jgi:hypothetical protein
MISRPTLAVAEPLSPQRQALRDALDAHREAEERLAALEIGRERARSARWATSTRIAEAETQLRDALAQEGSRIAFAFINDDQDTLTVSPVAEARAELDRVHDERQRNQTLEQALDQELAIAVRQVADRESDIRKAAAQVIVDSAEFEYLLAEVPKAWGRIRGLRIACHEINKACGEFIPPAFGDRWQAAPSLDPDALFQTTDPRPIEEWKKSLAALLEDPEAILPNDV